MKNLLILFSLLPTLLMAQKTHTVGPKETLFSIGRMYEVHPKELASYNKISFDEGVKIGQVLKIPEKKNMAPVAEKTQSSAALVTPAPSNTAPAPAQVTTSSNVNGKPKYHTVQKGESLYQIARSYPGINVAELKKWNKLGDGGLKEGQKLIVGFTSETVEVSAVPKQEAPKAQMAAKTEIPATTSTPQTPVVTTTTSSPAPKENVKVGDGGYFKSLFIVQSRAAGSPKSENGQAAVFKSNSGWDDSKYYCLFNSAPAGTILKITNANTQKFVYAKVLDVIPDVQQNEGVVVRLSNAAAAELGANGEKFQVSLNYQ